MKSDKSFKLSFATVCMNRLHHLKKTLPQNIENNKNYKNLEFVILDYNSVDEMEQWIKTNFMKFIKKGRIVYYKNPYPNQFNMAHFKNMVSRLGSGNIICLIDADNYTGQGYAKYINSCFNRNYNSFLTTIGKRKTTNIKDVLGRVCFRKDDFLAVEGFDESMNNYGFDDYDFANRLELIGRKRIIIKNNRFLEAIMHKDSERVKYLSNYSNFQDLYISHIDPSKSSLLFLFKDQTFNLGIVIENESANASNYKNTLLLKKHKYQYSIKKNRWNRGEWKFIRDEILLTFDNSKKLLFQLKGEILQNKNNIFYRIKNEEDIKGFILFHSEISNRNKLTVNEINKSFSVNNGTFGEGVVFKNFSNANPVLLK